MDSRIDTSQELSMILTNLEQSLNSTDSYWCTEKCNQCNANVRFRLTEISTENKKNIIEELKKHKHPSSRKDQNNENRSKYNAINELKTHYLKHHNPKKRPLENSKNFCNICGANFFSSNSLLMHKIRLNH
ncbi:hypothetical protein BpHYR1_000621 [Brachionus plicatilis]|uniref:C2H2-type domain-containing protein n=1 Tax=Brachionus plicatilis TaxID=10195 RepID=A0A3M7P453_BRAPC|nr:hypothetical protein BpHYR1_000621 [Brachionus plicatilis]